MFTQARIKLTAWYLLIILTISIAFSLVIYQGLTQELNRIEDMQQERFERLQQSLETGEPIPRGIIRRFQTPIIDPEIIAETKQRIIFFLVIVNGVITLAAAGAGYFLAGRTLRPIQQMVEEQNRFVSDASHELRTPLTSMRTELEVALLDKIDSKEAHNIIKSNLQEVMRLEDLTNNLLTLTRSENTVLIKSSHQLLDLVEHSLTVIAPKAKAKHIAIEQHIEDQEIQCHGPNITQLLIILLDNAIKFSPEKTTVTIASHHEHHTTIAISDQGPGISPEDQAHIFDRFYRADPSRQHDHTHGYGLGLAIAHEIIRKHQGFIKVENNADGGATFTVTL